MENEKNEKLETKRLKKQQILVAAKIVTAVSVACVLGGVVILMGSLLKNVKELQTENQEMEDFLVAMQATEEDDSFDYLAIGNSITKNPVVQDIWWGEWGMAATTEENDYVHLVDAGLQELYENVNTEALNFRIWENPVYYRDYTLQYLDGYLSEDLDLVTIMLGENIKANEEKGTLTDKQYQAQLAEEYENLITYIQEKAPNATVLMIGQFWEIENVEEAKEIACQKTEVTLIDLSKIQGEGYRVYSGDTVYGADGQEHEIGKDQAEHPNDEAMEYIANRILEKKDEF